MALKFEDLVYGKKYVPISKSVGQLLEESKQWEVSCKEGAGYLYYKGRGYSNTGRVEVARMAYPYNNGGADHFLPEDLVEYEDDKKVTEHTSGVVDVKISIPPEPEFETVDPDKLYTEDDFNFFLAELQERYEDILIDRGYSNDNRIKLLELLSKAVKEQLISLNSKGI